MARRHRLPWLVCGLWAGAAACAPSVGPHEAWRALCQASPFVLPETGAHVAVTGALLPGQRFAVVRLPAHAPLEVHSTAGTSEPSRTLASWVEALEQPGIVVNAGFYAADGHHVGLLKASDTWHTRTARSDWHGLLLCGPQDANEPACQLVDATSIEGGLGGPILAGLIGRYRHVVQSMLLYGDDQTLRTKRSPRRAARTALGIDAAGRLVLVLSERGVTLAELAAALQHPTLCLRRAMNLDGGLESQLAIASGQHRHLVLAVHGSRGEVPDAFVAQWPRPLPSILFAPASHRTP